ncbi:MAG: hydrogenase maturation nickel metallochaperone HypA [Chloroflexi bacterium]|nr:hydrogenase maturation nickel metallochaperone HypA [Chloroflexota bacterium]
MDDFPHSMNGWNGRLIRSKTMHELAVTQSILDISLRHAGEAGAKRITDINLVIGQFSSIVDDSVQFYWDIIAKETIAQGARLHFNRIPGEMTCNACGHTFRPTDETFECPACSSVTVRITKGEEFRVESIDVE